EISIAVPGDNGEYSGVRTASASSTGSRGTRSSSSLDVSANAVPSLPASSEPTPAGSGCPWYANGAEHATNPAVISSPVSTTAQTCSVVNARRRITQLILLGAYPQSTSCLI